MSAIYVCPAGKKIEVNVYGFKKIPKILRLYGSWYFDECIKCSKQHSYDYYLEESKFLDMPTIESHGYCKLKLDDDDC